MRLARAPSHVRQGSLADFVFTGAPRQEFEAHTDAQKATEQAQPRLSSDDMTELRARFEQGVQGDDDINLYTGSAD